MNLFSRTHPYLSKIKERYLLTAPHSTKKTYHICLEIPDSFLFRIGDSIGVLPTNDPMEVAQILKNIHATGEEEVFDKRSQSTFPLQEFLLHKANLFQVNSNFLKRVGLNLDQPQLKEYLHSHTLLEILQSRHSITPSDLAETLLPLLPRFYSVANSPKIFPNEIHLVVAYVEYELNSKPRRGIGSHFLCDLAEVEKTPIPIYTQASNHFTLPQDPSSSIILVGPGTGIAPFRAFLQERLAAQSQGRNWLFFGERNRSSDFYYEPFWIDLEKQGRLRLDLAFSRDTPQKLYVQHKMYEHRKSLWNWIEQGSYFYLCGDATEMAKDVDAMLHRIVCEEGKMTEEDGRIFLKKMRAEKRYLADVY